MKIRILGAHNREASNASCACFLIDDTLAIDAGGITSHLSIIEQNQLKAIFITHKHWDHIRDIPGVALNSSRAGKSIDIYSSKEVNSAIKEYLLNGDIFPKFHEIPEQNPTIRFVDVAPYESLRINGYTITPLPVNHVGITFGYKIRNHNDETVFFTADTGLGLSECWRDVSPQLLFVDVTMPNVFDDFARQTGHLTPANLKEELISFRDYQGYLPDVIPVHMDNGLEPQIRKELTAVSKSLNIPITVAQEGMKFSLS